MKQNELDVLELKRLITDSFLNESSEYYCKREDEKGMALQMLDEINKIEAFEGTLKECREMVNVKAFLPIHFWAFFFTQLKDLEGALKRNECERFIRLTVEGLTIAEIEIDL